MDHINYSAEHTLTIATRMIAVLTLTVTALFFLQGSLIETTAADDNNQPHAEIEQVSHDHALAGHAVTFSGSAEDNDGTVERYLWTSDIDGELLNDTSASSVELTIATLSPGEHEISFTVQDDDGAWSDPWSEYLFIVDPVHTPPQVSMNEPEGEIPLKGTVTLTGSLEPGAEVVWQQNQFGFQVTVISVTSSLPSVLDLDYLIMDHDGNAVTGGRGAVRSIYGLPIEDGTNPVAFHDYDRDGNVTSGDVFFLLNEDNGGFVRDGYRMTMVSNNVQKVEISIDNGTWETVDGTESWTYQWKTKSLDNGNHTVSIRSFDGTDYSQPLTFTLPVQNAKDGDDDSPAFGAAPLLFVVFVSAVFVKRRTNR